MRSGLTAAALGAALAASFLLSHGPPANGSDDLLLDEGFEDGVAEWAAGGGTLTSTSSVAHNGDSSAQFSADVDNDSGIIWSPPIAIRPEATYTLSGFLLKNDARVESVKLGLEWQDADGTRISRSPFMTLTGSNADWRRLTLEELSPPNAAYARVLVYVMADSGGTIYLDDVSLEGPPPLPATPTLAPSDTASPSLTLTPASRTPTPTRSPSATPSAVSSATPLPGIAGSLSNGGFEQADDGLPDGWRKYGGELSQTSGRYRSGKYSGEYRSSTDSTKWIYQEVAVTGGSAYQFDAYVLTDDPATREVFLRISWYASDDTSGSAIAVSDSPQHLSGSDPAFRQLTTGPALAPAETRSARLRIVLVPESSDLAVIFIDDASLQQVASVAAAAPAQPPLSEQEAPAELETELDEPQDASSPVLIARSSPSRQGESPYSVKINEAMYDPSPPGDDAAYEWLELYNAGSDAIDLAGWTLNDNSSEADMLPSLVLAPHGYVVVAAGEGFRDAYAEFAGALVTLASGRIGSGLANKGDRLLLLDASGKVADGVSWGDDASVLSPAIVAVAPGHSIERSPAGKDTDAASDFVDNSSPSPGRGFGERAVAGAAIRREAAGSSTISPPAEPAQEASSNVRQRLLVSLAAGIASMAVGLSIGYSGRRQFKPSP